jgi:multidrug efflux system membrane fusion protein
MRLFPILTAILVSVALYFIVLDRETLLNFARDTPLAATETGSTTPAEPAAAAAPETEDAARELVRVVVLSSQAEEIESAVVLRGRTKAARQVTVSAETTGAVISEPLLAGRFVEMGDLLCQLDAGTRESSLAEARARLSEAQGRVPEAQATVAEAEARIREAEINVNAARQLSEGGFASETRLIGAEATLESAQAARQRASSGVISAQAGIEAAQAAVAAAERRMDELSVTAPFAGVLETETAELGSLLQPGATCATVIQLDPIKMIGFVTEADVGKVTVGAPAMIRLLTGEAPVTGRVTFVSRSADDATRTFRVEVTAPNGDLAISDGQTAEILVQSEGRQAHLIPQSALTLNDEGQIGVRTVDDENITRFMPVNLIRDTTEGVWVADLPDQANVIVVGQEYVVDGVQVLPTYREAKG